MNVFIIHGAYGNSKENWFPWLKNKLESEGHTVYVPDFPTPENQELSVWLNIFNEKYFDKVNSDSIFIGHSLGPAFILNLIENLNIKPSACFFVSGFYKGLNNSKFDTINRSFIDKDFDWVKIKEHCHNFFIIHSKDDPYVPLSNSTELSNNLDGFLNIFGDAGHFNTDSGFIEFNSLFLSVLSFISSKGIIEKYPKLARNAVNFELMDLNLRNYHTSIINNDKTIHDHTLFTMALLNLTRQCNSVAKFCILNQKSYPLYGVIRQEIELMATAYYVSKDPENLKKIMTGSSDSADPDKKYPKIYNLVESSDKISPRIKEIYENYSNLVHPSKKSTASIFKSEGKDGELLNISFWDDGAILSDEEVRVILNDIYGLNQLIIQICAHIYPVKKVVYWKDLER